MPDSFARPEDISCSREGGLRIIGPYNESALENHRLIKLWRDAMHVKMIYDQVVFFSRADDRMTFTLAEFFVLWTDRVMPERWKLASCDMERRAMTLISLPRPRLVQQLEEAFEPLGFKAPWKRPMPPVPNKLLRAFGMPPKLCLDSIFGSRKVNIV